VSAGAGAVGCFLLCVALGVCEAFTLYVLSKFSERYRARTYSVLVRKALGRKLSARALRFPSLSIDIEKTTVTDVPSAVSMVVSMFRVEWSAMDRPPCCLCAVLPRCLPHCLRMRLLPAPLRSSMASSRCMRCSACKQSPRLARSGAFTTAVPGAVLSIIMVVYLWGSCIAYLVIIGDSFSPLLELTAGAPPESVCIISEPVDSAAPL